MTMITKSPHSSLTELQLKLLSFYREYYKEHGCYPRIYRAAEYLARPNSNIDSMVKALTAKGYMKKMDNGIYNLTNKK